MNNWFISGVKYTKQFEDGTLKRVTEKYLIQASSFTDAEARIYEKVGEFIRGEFSVKTVSIKNIQDIFVYEDSHVYYDAKIEYVSVDADNGKEKKVKNDFLVEANNIKQAYDRIQESLSDMMVSFEITSIKSSSIVDIYPL